jgi:hypothetical protein
MSEPVTIASDAVVAPVSEPVAVPVPVPAPAPAPSATEVVKAAIVDFTNKSDLLKYVLKTIAEVEILADRSDEDKAKFIVEEVKKAIRESPLSDQQKTDLAGWCDVTLPYVVEVVKLVKAEAGKIAVVALAEVKKCCPSWFSKAK